MLYLLAQILLCLAMALLAGGLIGWLWRGYRETDRLEDLRETLRATEEVKDRELVEAYRRADGAEARAESLERRLDEVGENLEQARRRLQERAAAEDDAAPAQERVGELESALREMRDRARDAEERARERGRQLEELERELEGRPAGGSEAGPDVAELRSEVKSLRAALDSKAEQLARAESRVIELEQLEARLQARERVADEVRSMAREESRRMEEDLRRLRARVAELEPLQERLDERGKEVNDLRRRYHDAVARIEAMESEIEDLERERDRARAQLASARDAADGTGDGGTEHPADHDGPDGATGESGDELASSVRAEVERLREALHRQIERNRRQEAVHRAVVANLREEIEATGDAATGEDDDARGG